MKSNSSFLNRNKINKTIPPVIYLIILISALFSLAYDLPSSQPSDDLSWVVMNMVNSDSLNPRVFNYPGGTLFYLSYSIIVFIKCILFSGLAELPRWTYILVLRMVNVLFFMLSVFFLEKSVTSLVGTRLRPFFILFFSITCGLFIAAKTSTANSGLYLGICMFYYFGVQLLLTGNKKHLFLAAMAIGIGMSGKYTAIFLIIPFNLLWFMWRKNKNIRSYILDMACSATVSIFIFLLFNPFIVFDFNKFLTDLHLVSVLEAPFFTSPSSVLSLSWQYACAFFTKPVIFSLPILLLAGLMLRKYLPVHISTANFKIIMLCVSGMIGYGLLLKSINIHQSRYYVPLLLHLGLIFALLTGYLNIAVERRKSKSAILLLSLVLITSTMSTAYLYYRTVKSSVNSPFFLARKDLVDFSGNISLVGYGIIILEPVMGSLTTNINFIDTSELHRADVNSYQDLINQVCVQLKQQNADIFIVPDIIFSWRIFHPYGSEYSERLKYQNPGQENWEKLFINQGYVLDRVYEYELYPIDYLLMGSHYSHTLEWQTIRWIRYKRVD